MSLKILSLLFVLFSFKAFAIEKVKVAEGFEIIWGMDFYENKILLTERRGRIKQLDLKTKKVTLINGGPEVYARGQGGLLDIKLHPQFNKNKRVYLTYAKNLGDRKVTALGYGVLNKNKLENFKDIFLAKGGVADGRKHFGSRITFDEENNIYMTLGDRGHRDNAQDLKTHFGKILKLTDEGKPAKDNPFINNKNALSEIWSLGHRNPQGLFLDAKTKTLYASEHGPRGGDEINIIKKGANYGWPIVSFGKEYWNPMYVGKKRNNHPGMIDAIKQFTPSIAPSGLILYRGEKLSKLKNSLISGSLILTHVNQYHLESKQEFRYFEGLRVRNVALSPLNEIYFSADDGVLYKIN